MAQANRPEGLSGGSRGASGITKGLTSKQIKVAENKQIAKLLKKSGLEKLAKINRTTSESDILFARAHGKISPQEAAAINPKLFPLADKTKTKVIATIDTKTGKVTRSK